MHETPSTAAVEQSETSNHWPPMCKFFGGFKIVNSLRGVGPGVTHSEGCLLNLLVNSDSFQVLVVFLQLHPASSVLAVLQHKVLLSSTRPKRLELGSEQAWYTRLLCSVPGRCLSQSPRLCALKRDDAANALLLGHTSHLTRCLRVGMGSWS